MSQLKVPISIIIPTYQREQILIETLAYIFALPVTAAQVIVVDQTTQHEPDVFSQLEQWHQQSKIHWICLSQPSIPHAMNEGAVAATSEVLLYLDDDIVPDSELVKSHWDAHQQYQNVIVVGRVIQPWEEDKELSPSDSPFATKEPGWREKFMGCNFSIHADELLNLGGFDENFVRVAYQFEAEFAYRWLQSERKIRFEPSACIHHLKVTNGGTRSHGHHLTTWQPNHTVGDYYYLLRAKHLSGRLNKIIFRPFRAVSTRHHLSHPWWIPVTLIAEFRGFVWALWLLWQGPVYIKDRQS